MRPLAALYAFWLVTFAPVDEFVVRASGFAIALLLIHNPKREGDKS